MDERQDQSKRAWPIWSIGILAIVLAAVGFSWSRTIEPEIVVLPTSFTSTVTATGTFTADAAPGTLARLSPGITQPLTVTIDVATVSADEDLVVVSQRETQSVGAATGPTQDVTVAGQYVLNRRSMENVPDARSWSVAADHNVDRSGSYTVGFGFDFDKNLTYQFWDDSIASSYALASPSDTTTPNAAHPGASPVSGSVSMQPADPVWIAALTPLQLPTTLTPAQWATAGFSQIAGTDAAVDAQYFVSIDTSLDINELSGSIEAIPHQTLTVSVAPDPAATGGTEATPMPVVTTVVQETAASVAKADQSLISTSHKLTLAERTMPRGLLAVAALLAVATIGLATRRQRTPI